MPTTTGTARGSAVPVAELSKDRMRDCERIFQEVLGPEFGFTEMDVVPAWEMFTTSLNGGLVLGGFVDDSLAGFSYAFPGFDGKRVFLFSCGLYVRPCFESKGVGFSLKLAQREHALAAGYDLIRWTTGSLGSRPLYLYLTRLGASLVGISPDLYADFRPHAPADEVHIDWRLEDPVPDADEARAAASRPVGCQVTRTAVGSDGTRTFEEVVPRAPSDRLYGVELPWVARELQRASPAEARRWRVGVRHAISPLLQAGYRGVGVALDRSARRSHLLFDRIA